MSTQKGLRSLLNTKYASSPRISRAKVKLRRRLQWLMCDSWALECTALAISGISLTSIGIMLGVYNDRPLSSWSHTISLNTALSTLGTVMKGFMMVSVGSCLGQLKWIWYAQQKQKLHDFQVFDQASRGPWGSVLLLFRLKFWHLASVGAVSTILALASDSFVQQSVSYPLWDDAQSHQIASVPSTQAWSQFSTVQVGGGASLAPYFIFGITVPQPINAAVYDGVLDSDIGNSASAIRPICPSGNCSFTPSASIGVCSQCASVSDLLSFMTDQDPSTSVTGRWVLPNGHEFVLYEGQNLFSNITTSVVDSTGLDTTNIAPLALNSDTVAAYNSLGTLSNTSIIALTLPNTLYAVDCMFYICSRSYNASIRLNKYQENVTSVHDRPVWTSNNAENAPGPGISLGFTVPSAEFPDIPSQNLTFQISQRALTALKQALGAFAGSVGLTSEGVLSSSTGLAQGFWYETYNGARQPSEVMESVAQSITNSIRQNSGDIHIGTTWALTSHIVVKWLWLLLPLTMVLLAAVFLALTIRQTKLSGVPGWRSSALAVMEHGVNTTLLESAAELGRVHMPGDGHGKETMGELEIWAEGVTVRLRRRGVNACGYGLSVT